MAENLVHAEIREVTGKEYAKKLRVDGKIPGIFYAQNKKPISLIFDEVEIMKILSSEHNLIDIQIGSKRKRKAIIKEVQSDPLHQTLVHVDIMGVRLKEKINVAIPIHILGEAVGVKDHGGILHSYLREIEVNCLPLDLPEFIEIDVSELMVGDSIVLNSLSIDKIEFVGDIDRPIVSVVAPALVIEEEEEEEGDEEEGEEETTTEEDNE